MRSWSEDKDVHTPDDITAVARTAGMDDQEIADCLAAMKTAAVKTALMVGIFINCLFILLCILPPRR